MHDHDHAHAHPVDRGAQRRALRLALVANAGFLVVEFVTGLATHSLALLADAAHMASDVVALVIALVAQALLARPATDRHSYGLQRAEVLGAQANGIGLVVVAAWITVTAVQRLGSPADVRGGGLLVVATIGLVVNLGSVVVLKRAAGDSLNMRAAVLHMGLDAAGSVAAMAAGVAALGGAHRVDPAVSIVVAALVLWSAWGLLRSTAHVLLEGTPPGVDPDAVADALLAEAGVEAVHHLHVWSLASDVPALSAHVVLGGEQTLHEAQAAGGRLKELLDHRFGITHATLELECHPCDDPPGR
ncbi:MAG: cation diffusion facilitator family transporter [Actinomycetia bacterium]|nr:cation diffusion facilitator family transporter [Actinomycetes bacterium]